jgi:hypothetical protein
MNNASAPAPTFDGETIAPEDNPRLSAQLDRVRDLMLDGRWRTLAAVSKALGYPEASVSARIRDMRKAKFGEFVVERKHHSRGLWYYRVAGRVVRDGVQLELL